MGCREQIAFGSSVVEPEMIEDWSYSFLKSCSSR